MLFEKLGWKRALNIVNKIMVPVVLFGVLLSTLHQSSLGAVYLIMPTKLSPLWYSSALPYMFLVSAVMMGLSMVSFETILSSKAFHHVLPVEVLKGLARGTLVLGSIYLVMKLLDLARGAGIGYAFNGSALSNLWLLEMGVGVVLPLILLSMKSVREDINRIFVVNILVILGVVLNRINVGIFGVAEYATRVGGDYFPSFIEVMVTAAMVAFAILGFKVCAKYLNLYPEAQS
jgi:Ni/Fe-hydrogenase subunit HybB-like protein